MNDADIEDWSTLELISSLEALARQIQTPVKFAFFL